MGRREAMTTIGAGLTLMGLSACQRAAESAGFGTPTGEEIKKPATEAVMRIVESARATEEEVTPSPTQTPVPSGQAVQKIEKWGFFGGSLDKSRELVEKTGSRDRLIATFVGWYEEGEIESEVINYAREANRKIIVFWEAYTPGREVDDDPDYSQREILGGRHDPYIRNFAKSIQEAGVEVLIYPFPEANLGIAQTESVNGNDGRFKEMFDHVAGFFEGIKGVELGVSLNFTFSPEELNQYRADKATTVGLSVFNFGEPQEPWMSYRTLSKTTLSEVAEWGKKIMIASIGCRPDPKRKEWLEEAATAMGAAGHEVNFFFENKDPEGKKEGWERNWEPNDEELAALRKYLA